jgi:hypothetical protein
MYSSESILTFLKNKLSSPSDMKSKPKTLFADFLFNLFLTLEAGGKKFLGNVGRLSTGYNTSHH